MGKYFLFTFGLPNCKTKLNKMSNLARMVNCSRSVVMARWQKPVISAAVQNPMASRELSTTTVKNDIGFPSALALTKFAAGGAMFTAFMNGLKTPFPGSETGEWAAPLFGYLLIFWIPIYYTLGLIV